MRAIIVLFAGLLVVACSSGTPSPEQQARIDYARIKDQANAVLFGAPLGYLDATGAIDRSTVRCQKNTCVSTTTRPVQPKSFSVETTEIEVLPEMGGVRSVIENFQDEVLALDVYGIWLDHSFHAVERVRYATPEDISAVPTRLFTYSVGSSTFDNPRRADGSARWEGLMAGRDLTTSPVRGELVAGDAAVTVSFGEQAVTADVAFVGLVNLESGGRRPDMQWRGLAIENGGFGRRNAPDDTISGRFYGPQHVEVGGVFERSGIAGVFGARRNAP